MMEYIRTQYSSNTRENRTIRQRLRRKLDAMAAANDTISQEEHDGMIYFWFIDPNA